MRFLVLFLSLAAGVWGLGCARMGDAPPTLSAGTDAQARAVATRLFDAAVARQAAAVQAALCAPLAERSAVLLEPGQALAIERFQILSVEPTWAGAEPMFFVEVELTRNAALLPRAVRVRAREGCVDQLLDNLPVGSRPPDPGEIAL